MASSWREEAQKLFGDDAVSEFGLEIDLEEVLKSIEKEMGSICEDIDYHTLLKTLVRTKMLEKVKVYPPSLKVFRDSEQNPYLPGPHLDPDRPPTAPFEHKDSDCKKNCSICFPQYFPAHCSVSTEDAQKATRVLATAIKSAHDHLCRILETHADDLANRWNKMSQKKRYDLLESSGDFCAKQPVLVHLTNTNLEIGKDHVFRRTARQIASPDLPKYRKDFESLWQKRVPMLLEGFKTKFLDAWLLPYLDIESFSRSPLLFLSLLSSRTRYTPDKWTLFDKMHIVAAEYSQIIPGQYNAKCISFHPDHYGCLRDWDKTLAHQQVILGYNQGMLVLTAQDRMMAFLRKVVDALFCEIQARRRPGEVIDGGELDTTDLCQSGRVQEKWSQLVKNGFSTFGKHPVVSWSSYTNQHLVAPPHADPVALRNKIRAVYQNAYDGLWALQTDPGTVQLAVKEFCSCLYFHYLDKTKEWNRITDEVILVPMRRELQWRQMLMECDCLTIAHEALEKEDTEENRLRFDMSLRLLWDCCTDLLIQAIQDLHYSIPYQPGFEKNFTWQRGSNGRREAPRICSKDWFKEDPLFWSLDCFCNDPYRDFNCDPVVYLRVFDDQLRNASEKEQRRISPAILTQVGDLAAIDEIRIAIQCTRGINQNSLEEYRTDPRFKAESKKRFEPQRTFNQARSHVLNARDLCRAASPALKKLCTQHPWPKGKTTTDTAQRAADARESLAQIWEEIRGVLNGAITKTGMSGPLIQEYVDIWSLDLSEEYQDLKLEEQSEIKAVLQANLRAKSRLREAKLTLPVRPKSMTTLDSSAPLNLRKAVLQDLSTNKTKTKTHGDSFGTTSSSVPDDSAISASIEDGVDIERVKVKLASLPLLHQMFPSEGLFRDSNTTGKAATGLRSWKWQHFVDVMLDIGFKVSQGSGSAVSFEHPAGRGRIVFHQPHPQPIIEPQMMRFMGRRMTRWFGWQRETFVAK